MKKNFDFFKYCFGALCVVFSPEVKASANHSMHFITLENNAKSCIYTFLDNSSLVSLSSSSRPLHAQTQQAIQQRKKQIACLELFSKAQKLDEKEINVQNFDRSFRPSVQNFIDVFGEHKLDLFPTNFHERPNAQAHLRILLEKQNPAWNIWPMIERLYNVLNQKKSLSSALCLANIVQQSPWLKGQNFKIQYATNLLTQIMLEVRVVKETYDKAPAQDLSQLMNKFEAIEKDLPYLDKTAHCKCEIYRLLILKLSDPLEISNWRKKFLHYLATCHAGFQKQKAHSLYFSFASDKNSA